MEPWFPPSTNGWLVLAALLGTWIVCDFLFVRILKLGKIGWKRTDYFWLGLASLGIFGLSRSAREMMASWQAPIYEAQTARTYGDVKGFAKSYGRGGIMCRTFVRSEWSPPKEEFERSQREYDVVCEWLKKVEDTLPERFEDQLIPSALPPRPTVSKVLSWVFQEFDKEVKVYNGTQEILVRVRQATKKDSLDATLILLSPWLTALALGLRLAKTSGEIRLERASQPLPPNPRT